MLGKLFFLLTLFGAGYVVAKLVAPDLKRYYEISTM